jgi:hypothetical protein
MSRVPSFDPSSTNHYFLFDRTQIDGQHAMKTMRRMVACSL